MFFVRSTIFSKSILFKIYLLFFIFLLPDIYFAATINGYVFDKENNRPLIGANVLLDYQIGTISKSNGFYEFKDVSLGKHFLNASFLAYLTAFDSVKVTSDEQIIQINFFLDPGKIYIDTVAEIENYHRYFINLKPENVLEIVLDSFYIEPQNPVLKIYSTFYNKTEKSIFVLRDVGCIDMIVPLIYNSNRKYSIKSNSIRFDCVGEKTMPDSSDFIEIEPFSSVVYPAFIIELYNFSSFANDNYEIKIKYSFQQRTILPGFNNPEFKDKYGKQIFYYNMALRGEFISSNFLSFKNEFMTE